MQQDLLQIISTFNLNGKEIKVYGSIENPLYSCTQINVHILEYKKSSHFSWYKRNKDEKFIVFGKIFKNKIESFYTQRGLYQALFKSDLQFGEDFQQSIIDILISLDNGKRIIYNQDDKQTINNEILQNLLDKASLYEQIEKLQEKIENLEIKIYTYRIEVFNRKGKTIGVYIGTTENPNRRAVQHIACSSNKDLKNYIKNGFDFRIQIQEIVTDYKGNERVKSEQRAINNVPKHLLLNKQKNLIKKKKIQIRNYSEGQEVISRIKRKKIDQMSIISEKQSILEQQSINIKQIKF